MASNDEDLCTSHADFAVICSFIDKFGEKLGLTLPNIGELQIYFEDTDNVNPLLSQGVCLLLRRINKSVKFDRWERGLQRFAHTYSHQDGWELERFGFKKAKLEVKIRVFKNLLEAQFDLYKCFKDKVNLLGVGELRLQPCGRDKRGISYWSQLDDCANLRIYSDDQDEETWTLVASSREELVALIAELQSESPPGASREMSVDGSHSGTVTPMGLSEAPTPVDSKATTPVASGRTSPVIDNGQGKDDSVKIEEKKFKTDVVVEKIKEKLKVEETEEEKDDEKLDESLVKRTEDSEVKKDNRLSENKEEDLKKDSKDNTANAVETKVEATREKETLSSEQKPDVRAGEQQREEVSVPQEIDDRPEDKPLPVNKDTVMRERDKKPFELNERNEGKRKETVWDKLSKQKEERAESLLAEKSAKEMGKTLTGSERFFDGKPNLKFAKLNRETDKLPVESQKDLGASPMEVAESISKASDERKAESKVSDLGHGPKQDKTPLGPEMQHAKQSSSIADESAGPVRKTVVEKAYRSPFPSSIGSVSITPVQPPKDHAENIFKKLPLSTTITPASKPLSSTGPLSPTSKTGPFSPPSKPGPLSPTSTVGSLSVIPVPAHKTGSFPKGGPLSPTSVPFGKSGPLSPTSVSITKSGPLFPTSVSTIKSGPLSPSSVSLSKSGTPSSTVIVQSKGVPLSPTSVVSSRIGGPLSTSSVSVDKEASSVQAPSKGVIESSSSSSEAEKKSQDAQAVKSLASTVSSTKCLPSTQTAVPTASGSNPSVVQHSKIPVSASNEMATSNIPPLSLSSNKGLSPTEISSAKNLQSSHPAVPSDLNSQRISANDTSEGLTSEDIIPPFPPIPTKGTRLETPKDAPPTTSVLTLKRVPPRRPASTAEAIPSSNARAPPLDSIPHPAPNETSFPPFPPAPGEFPSVPKLTPSDVPRVPVVPVSKNQSIRYFKSPSKLAPSSTLIPEGISAVKVSPFREMAPEVPEVSKASSAPFPQVPSTFPKVSVNNKETPSASVTTVCASKSSSTYFASPTKFTSSSTIPTPATRAPSISKDANITEPPQKKAKIDDMKLESQKESLKETTQVGSGSILSLLKRSHVTSPDEKKEVGGPHEAKVMRKEVTSAASTEDAKQTKTEEIPTKVPLLTNSPPLHIKDLPATNSGIESKDNISTKETQSTEVKPSIAVNKPGAEPGRRLLKLHNFRQTLGLTPATSEPGEKKPENPGTGGNIGSEATTKEPDVGEAIEEPVMIVKGEGEGAKCESGNDLRYLDRDCKSHSSKPWWECFDNVSNSRNIVTYDDSCETIEEHVMYFWGDGNGADCEAGNNGDETETNAETKQGDSGTSTLVAADNRGNSTSGDVKPQKEKETAKTDSDLKEVDGIADSDDAKVNGLRTLESVEKTEKTINQLDKTESKGDGKHSGVNGKNSKEDNDVGEEKTPSINKNSKLGEGKSKKDKSLEVENCEDVVNDKDEKKVQIQDSSKEKEDGSTVKLDASKKEAGEVKERSRETSGKRGTRNRASLEEVRDVSEEESDRDEEEHDEEERETAKEKSTSLKKKRGRPKGSTTAARGRKSRQVRSSSQRASDGEEGEGGEEEEEEEEDDGEDDNEEGENEEGDDNQEGTKKRRQRGKGCSSRPLPDAPRQRSARIARLREKEEDDRRHLEALRMKQLADENRSKEMKRKAREERRALRAIKKGRQEKKDKKDKEKKKKKKKKQQKRKTNTGDPWENSSSSSSSSSEEEEIEEEEEENLEFKSDHEFSPESDIEDADAQPIKRARTAKKGKKVVEKAEVEEEEQEEEESEEDQTQCTKCGHDDHPETILLCDNCDAGWHLSCLRPPLLSVPEGDWICPTCEHVMLVKKLREVLERFDECQKKAHNEEVRRQRLAYVSVSLDNILPEGGKKKKKKRREDGEEGDDDESGSDSDSEDSDSESDDSSESSSESSTDSEPPLYTLRARSARTLKEQVEDFDEMINEAIRDEMEAAAGAGNAGRGKDIDNIIQASDEGEGDEEELDKEKEVKGEAEVGEVENKENEKPSMEVAPSEEAKEEKKEDGEEVKREREDDEDDEDVAPKRKKQKPLESGSGKDDDYKDSDEHSDSDDDDEVKKVRKRIKPYNMYSKKRRRLTDLDAEDDDDASDEDFMNSSEDEDEESDESAASSSSLATEYDSDDSDVGKRRRGSRSENLPLRRSARNRTSCPYDEDSDEDKCVKRGKKKKKRRKSSSEEAESSDSENSYNKKKKKVKPRRYFGRIKARRGSKKGRGKKPTKSKPKAKKAVGEDGEEKPTKPRIKYSKPPKSKDDQDDEVVTQKRVTRGRQVSYYDALLTDESSEEEKQWRGKVMKGERAPTESSEYEASEDEMKKRRGICGGQGRGKVMKGEEDDEEELDAAKKKRGRPKKDDDELIGKPSPPRPSTIRPNPLMQVTAVSPTPAPFMQATSVSPTPPSAKQATSILPIAARVKPTDLSITPSSALASALAAKAPPLHHAKASIPPAKALSVTVPPAAFVTAAASPVHRTPEAAASPSPAAPAAKILPASLAGTANLGSNSPGHQQPLGKWSPHLSGVTITNVTASSAPGTPPRSNVCSAPGSGTPPRPSLSGPPVTASPPPPYRSSPLPLTSVGRGTTPASTAPSSMPPGGPPNTSSPHSTPYPPYRPPPEHYSPHPGKERFPSHPAFPEYAPPGRHSPSPHGVPPRHPSHIPSGHSLPHMPPGYGPPGPGSYPPGGVPPHPGVLRGPPHDLYRPPHSTHPGHGSPSHPGHPHLVMKPGYPGLEPLPYAGSPGPSPGPMGIHQGSQDSPAQQSPNEDSKEGTLPTNKGPGEFSSGLMSYFSSQRDDDVE